ncbi:MAG: hypothetical protein WBQ57_07390, partial [Rhodanobacteraceae bacterium]
MAPVWRDATPSPASAAVTLRLLLERRPAGYHDGMKRLAFQFAQIALALLAVAGMPGCHDLRDSLASASTRADITAVTMTGTFDNHAQVWQSRATASPAPPHVILTIDPATEHWSIWQVHLDTVTAMDASWAMQRTSGADGMTTLVPYRALVAKPAYGKDFDARQWAALDACALKAVAAKQAFRAEANAAACATIAPGIGSDAALLPLTVERDGEWMRVRFYADQARGSDARENLR